MKKITKNMKYIISAISLLVAIFGVNIKTSEAWTYNGTSIPYTVTAAPVITVSLSAAPTTMTLPANQTVLSWTTTGSPDSCVGASTPSGTSWNGMSLSPSGSGGSPITVSGLTAGTYVFDITCTKAGSSPASDSEVVVVNPAPTTQCSDSVDNADPEDSDADINDPGCHVGDIITNAYVPSDDDETNAPPSPSGTISATSCTISAGGSTCNSLVTWTTANLSIAPTEVTHNNPSATHVSWDTSGTNVSSTVNYGSTVFFLYHNSIELAQSLVSATCTGGTTWNGSSCQITPPPTPSVTLNALPSTVFTGNAATLSWTSENVSSCTASASPISGSWTGARPTSSSFPHESTGALSATTTFRLSCDGAYGPASDQKTVTVAVGDPGDILPDLTATPERINLGESSTLTWSCLGAATSSNGIGFSTGGTLNGSISVSPVVNTTYTLNCTNGPDSASDQATVTLKRKFFFIEF